MLCSRCKRVLRQGSRSDYLERVRRQRVAKIRRGMEAMDAGLPVTHAAEAAGYSDLFAFSRAVKELLGAAPSRLRGTDWRALMDRAA